MTRTDGNDGNRRCAFLLNARRFRATVVTVVLFALPSELPGQTRQLDVAAVLADDQATVSNSEIDIGPIDNIFDGNTNSLARTANVNPMVITLTFSVRVDLAGSHIFFLGGDSEWRVETADSVEELESMTGSFRVALDWSHAPIPCGRSAPSMTRSSAASSG